ncbi:MAG TPA: potassium channel family protein [Candidatus Sulfotelmatobacter sp.]|nr:potassium channel family protein [Candidatus Sulfotelmatobacter sp.]
MADPKNQKDFEEIKSEYRAIHRQYLLSLAAALIALFGGALVYKHLMHLSWLNAVYFCTVTLTTVGYGDIHPDNDSSKLFTIFYLFVGIAIIGSFINVLIRHNVARREYRKAKRKNII